MKLKTVYTLKLMVYIIFESECDIMNSDFIYNVYGEKITWYYFKHSILRITVLANGFIDKMVYDSINNTIYKNRFDGIKYKK